jgi:hypothetical protein
MKRTAEELEAEVFDLKCALAAAEAEKKYDPLDVTRYVNEIAPKTADLPPIMTMCTPAERKQVVASLRGKSREGHWIGGRAGTGKRPKVSAVTQRSKDEEKAGFRKPQNKKPTKSGKVREGSARVTIYVTHAVLIGAGAYPTERRNFASHICHDNDCIVRDHLQWETAGDNLRRDRLCRPRRECRCGLQPPCNFMLHPNNTK